MLMKRFSDDERGTTFGQTMCTLRAALGLTQAELAKMLGVSQRAVGNWEVDRSYPKVEHLKELIDLGVKRKAFPAGHEVEAIRALWEMAHQKEVLDGQWLATVLGQWSPLLSVETPGPGLREETPASSPSQIPAASPRVDWGAALSVPNFYGRKFEQNVLTQWVMQERCRVVSLVGIGGIGKSALVVRLMHHMAVDFEVVIFRALRDAPLCQELLDDCLQVLCPQALATLPAGVRARIGLLLEQMRTRRVLLVLDSLEAILQEGDVKGYLRPGFEDYEHVLRRVAETEHQSCLLLTSREKLALLGPLEGSRSPVRSLRLRGLEIAACQQLLAEKGVVGTQEEQAHLSKVYGGNPLALQIVGETINDLFGGEIDQFLSGGVVVFGSITDLLDQQFTRLSRLEQMVLRWLAIVREPVTINELLALLVTSSLFAQMLEVLTSLWRRSLIERGQRPGSFTLQAVVSEYVTAGLVEETISEIGQRKLNHLLEHGLEQAHAKTYVRQTQDRLLITPILVGLRSRLGGQTAVEKWLQQLLDHLRVLPDLAQGYGPANLVALLHFLRGHLRAVNLSHLSLRGVYLQGIEMQDASLVGSILRDTIFTEILDASWSVAISRTGRYWAAGSWRGEVWVWSEGGQYLHLAWQAHTDNIFTLTFSPDERTLATVSWDGTLKLWDLQSGSLLWTSWLAVPYSLAFAPDGHTLASGGDDACIRLWDIPSGMCVHDSIRFWVPATGRCLQVLQDPDSEETMFFGAVWSPDGQLLVSATYMHGVQMWEMRTFTRCWVDRQYPSKIRRVAWSPDGTRLAGCGDDGICLWELSGGILRRSREWQRGMLSVVWSPDGKWLACGGGSGSVGEVLVWDISSEDREKPRLSLSGLASAVFAVAWSPSGKVLVSGDNRGYLCWWDVETGACLRKCEGHLGSVLSLKVSPDGRVLASGGHDSTIRLWDLESGQLLHTLRRDRPYERLNITDIRGITAAQKATLKALGAIEVKNLS
jgi:WD40 repeat protein/transcriptional regulator with XRE-family HTH domain